jgi:hypothetical protein
MKTIEVIKDKKWEFYTDEEVFDTYDIREPILPFKFVGETQRTNTFNEITETKTFKYCLDARGIVWISDYEGILERPCLQFCLTQIAQYDILGAIRLYELMSEEAKNRYRDKSEKNLIFNNWTYIAWQEKDTFRSFRNTEGELIFKREPDIYGSNKHN